MKRNQNYHSQLKKLSEKKDCIASKFKVYQNPPRVQPCFRSSSRDFNVSLLNTNQKCSDVVQRLTLEWEVKTRQDIGNNPALLSTDWSAVLNSASQKRYENIEVNPIMIDKNAQQYRKHEDLSYLTKNRMKQAYEQ